MIRGAAAAILGLAACLSPPAPTGDDAGVTPDAAQDSTTCDDEVGRERILCEGFESYPDVVAFWTVDDDDGVTEIDVPLDAAAAYRGERHGALDLDEASPTMFGVTFAQGDIVLGLGETIALRAYVQLRRWPGARLFHVYGPDFVGPHVVITAALRPGVAGDGAPQLATDVLTLDRWYCVEMIAELTTAEQGVVSLEVDGVEVARFVGPTIRGQAEALELGVVFPDGEAPPPALGLDEVVLAYERTGCDSP